MLFSLAFITAAMICSCLIGVALLDMLNRQSKEKDALFSQVGKLKSDLARTESMLDIYKNTVASHILEQARLKELDAANNERRRRIYNPRTPGFVYLIRDIDVSGYCKIGRARYPKHRLHTFEVKLPFKTEVLAVIETSDPVTLETELHHRFAGCRVRGEWFALTPADIDAIKHEYPS